MRTFANRFRSTTWCHRPTYVAKCSHCHPSIVAKLQATGRLLETLESAIQPEQVVLLELGQLVERLVLVLAESVQLALVARLTIAVVHTGRCRFVVQLAVVHRSTS